MILPHLKKGLFFIFSFFIFSLNLYGEAFEISGFINSDNQQNISTKYNGYVEKIFVNEGDIVAKGTQLLQIDLKEMNTTKSQTQIAKQQAQLTYAMNKSDLDKTTLDYNRYKALYDKNAISRVSFEEIKLKKENLEKTLEISKQQVKQYEDKLQEIQKQFQYLNIKAQSKALIISKSINEGELAVAGATLMVICDIENLVVYLDVSESDLTLFRDKPNIDIVVDSLNLTLKPNKVVILPAAEQGMNNFRVKLTFKSSDKRILPGMYVKVIVK
ncbi:MAG: efflux RND transporter periplasmic adaptor subunit [Candidatus Marinarcus sp.]|uniref:efflux RND transporter periplasmic adaptor subunit n=1 Tax=Candidatus Marinarcus sp. TaxID=3100987 RepID=UPI003B00FF7F